MSTEENVDLNRSATVDKSKPHATSQLLQAWNDKVAGVAAYSGAITTVSLYGDGHRLVIADEDRKLKVSPVC
jgi:hypothetical protein